MKDKIETTSQALDLFFKGKVSRSSHLLLFFKENFDESLEVEPQFRRYMNERAIIRGYARHSTEWRIHRSFLNFLIAQRFTFLKNDLIDLQEGFMNLLTWNYPQSNFKVASYNHALSLKPLAKRLNYDIRKLTFENIKDYVVRRSSDKRFNPLAILDFVSAIKNLVDTDDRSSLSDQDLEILNIVNQIDRAQLDQTLRFVETFCHSREWKRVIERKPQLLEDNARKLILKKLRGEQKVMFCLMAWNGLGFEELFDLSRFDISLQERYLQVTDEKNKPARIPLFDIPTKQLELYLRSKMKNSLESQGESDLLFISKADSREEFNRELRLASGNELLEADDLKFTAGRSLYKEDIKIEGIQKILRLTNLNQIEYCYSDILEKEYFRRMRDC